MKTKDEALQAIRENTRQLPAKERYIIDEALDSIEEAYRTGYARGAAAARARQQGEWKKKTDGLPHLVQITWYECSRCSNTNADRTQYCPNCGAVMSE